MTCADMSAALTGAAVSAAVLITFAVGYLIYDRR